LAAVTMAERARKIIISPTLRLLLAVILSILDANSLSIVADR